MIDEFRGKYYFLSNFFTASVEYKGIQYQNNEAAFQAMKCENIEKRKEFSNLPPNEAKRLGRKVNLRSDWENIKFGVMREVVHQKFSQNPYLAEKLIQTYPEKLIEGNTWHDNTYGNCVCDRCRDIPGKNMLGKILMEERNLLIRNQKSS